MAKISKPLPALNLYWLGAFAVFTVPLAALGFFVTWAVVHG